MNIPEMIIEACIKALGRETWDSLTGEQQHDVIMGIVKDLLNRLG